MIFNTFDPAGRPTFSANKLCVKFTGAAAVGWDYTGGTKSGTINDVRFTQYPGCVPYVMVISGNMDIGGYMPSLTVSGNTLTWNYPKDAAQNFTRPNTIFIYGIF
jgi:hypothetical protein